MDETVKLVIRDGNNIVRTMNVGKNAAAGLNRVWWDLRTDRTPDFKLRMPPQHLTDFPVGPDGTRKLPNVDPLSSLVPPGTYTVSLLVEGKETSRPQPVVVRKDPNSTGTEADIQAQTRMLGQIREQVTAATHLVNTAESIRSQSKHMLDLAASTDSPEAIRRAVAELDRRIVAVESRLFNTTSTGRGQDQLRLPSQLIEKFSHLADVVGLNDFTPTTQEAQVLDKLTKELAAAREQFTAITATDVPTFNKVLAQYKLGAIADK